MEEIDNGAMFLVLGAGYVHLFLNDSLSCRNATR